MKCQRLQTEEDISSRCGDLPASCLGDLLFGTPSINAVQESHLCSEPQSSSWKFHMLKQISPSRGLKALPRGPSCETSACVCERPASRFGSAGVVCKASVAAACRAGLPAPNTPDSFGVVICKPKVSFSFVYGRRPRTLHTAMGVRLSVCLVITTAPSCKALRIPFP